MSFREPMAILALFLGLLSQQVSSQPATSQCKSSLDLMLLLDSSGSLGRVSWREIQSTAVSLVDALPISPTEINMGYVVFSGILENIVPPSGDKAYLKQQAENFEWLQTSTATDLAINEGVRQLQNARPDVSDAIIVITDGSADNPTLAKEAADRARSLNMPVFVIAIGSGISEQDLLDLVGAQYPERILQVDDTTGLINDVIAITDQACVETVTTAPPPTTTTMTTTTTTTPATTPTPNPCPTGRTDVWFLLDQSEQARQSATMETDFDLLQAALTYFVQNPGVTSSTANPIRVGVIAYTSSGSSVVKGLTNVVAASNTFTSIIPDPNVNPGNSFTFLGLRTFETISLQSVSNTWIVLVSSVDSSSGSNSDTAFLYAQQLRTRGFKIHVIGIAGPDGTLDEAELRQVADNSVVRRLSSHDQLPAALAEFGRNQLCLSMVDPVRDDLCANAKLKDGVGYLYHPTDCDKFIQCHYHNTSGATVAVYRTCPLGQYWDQASLQCDQACNVDCPEEKCHDNRVDTYPMEGSCRAFWRCEHYKSKPTCCPPSHQYLPGRGCVWNPRCNDPCGPRVTQDDKGPCTTMTPDPLQVVQFSRDRNSDMYDGHKKHRHSPKCRQWYSSALLWHSELDACTEQFDLLSCQCVKRDPRDQAENCQPSTDLQFSKAGQMTTTSSHHYDLRDVTLADGVAKFPGTLGSLLHLTVEEREGRPLAIALRYRENAPVAKQLYLLRSTRCEAGGWLEVILQSESVTLRISSKSGEHASTTVSTQGFSATAWKDLRVVYDGSSVTLSVSSGKLHYVSRVDAPKIRCFACGLDVAPGGSVESFTGDLEFVQLSYCYPRAVSTK